MSFLEPQRLWLLVVVGALAVAYVAVLRWRRAATLRFTTVDLLDESCRGDRSGAAMSSPACSCSACPPA